jgi:hypothetical protein
LSKEVLSIVIFKYRLKNFFLFSDNSELFKCVTHI